MAADLGLVAHAAQADAQELAAQRFGDAFAQRGLADARRAHKAEDRAFHLVARQLAHGDMFDDARLDLLKPVMRAFQDVFGVFQVQVFLAELMPGQSQQPVEIGVDDARLRRHRRDDAQARHFFHGFLVDFAGQARASNALLQLVDFLLEYIAVAQFLLNDANLLAQVHFALIGRDFVLQPRMHFVVDFVVLQFAGQQHGQQFQALLHIVQLKQLLQVIRRQGQNRRERIA